MTKNVQPQDKKTDMTVTRKTQILIIVVLCVLGAGTIALVALSIMTPRNTSPGVQNGVGADGFRAYVEEGTSLSVDKVASKNQVIASLGSKAKSVGDAQVSKVFNYNGNRGQTLTFPIVRADGVTASIYIDKKIYKTTQALNDDHIYVATMKAGDVNGHPLYYRHAQTIGNDREYHLMVVNGKNVYRFVFTQPDGNITISEVGALAALKSLAQKAKL